MTEASSLQPKWMRGKSVSATSGRSGGAARSSELPAVGSAELAAADGVEDRRRDVGQLGGRVDRLSRPGAARELDEQRHLERLSIEEDAVGVVAVVAEPFAVIRHQDDESVVVVPQFAQTVEQAAHEVVGVGDLGIVAVAVAGRERRWSGVRGVRLVDVEEEEEPPVLAGAEPGRGARAGSPRRSARPPSGPWPCPRAARRRRSRSPPRARSPRGARSSRPRRPSCSPASRAGWAGRTGGPRP